MCFEFLCGRTVSICVGAGALFKVGQKQISKTTHDKINLTLQMRKRWPLRASLSF